MATKTWVGTTSSYNTAGNWSPSGVPAAGDDVVMSNAANCVIDIATTALGSFDQTGYTGVMSGSLDITVRGLANNTRVFKIQNGANHTWTGRMSVAFVATTAQVNVTFGGLTTSTNFLTSAVQGTCYLLDSANFAATYGIAVSSANFHLDGLTDNAGLTHNVGIFSTTSGTRTIYFGNCTINMSSIGTNAFNTTSAGLTIAANTATVNMTGSGGGFTGANINFNGLTLTHSGTTGKINSSGFTVKNFYVIPSASVTTQAFTIYGDFTVTNELKFLGVLSQYRAFITSDIIGTPRTITVGGATLSNSNYFDLRDIQFNNSGSNISFTALSAGDCGGNGMSGGGTLFFPGTTTQTWDGAASNFSIVGHWTSRIPLPQDNVVFAGTNTCTMDMPRVGKNISFSAACKISVASTPLTFYGDVNFTNAGTLSFSGNTYFESSIRSGTITITSAGKTIRTPFFQAFGVTVNLADAFTSGAYVATLSNGTLNDGGFTLTALRFICSGTFVCAVNKTGSWTISSNTASTVLDLTNASLTWSDTAGTITLSGASANLSTLNLGGETIHDMLFSGAASNAGFLITGANTFNTITLSNYAKVTFPASTTQNVANFVSNGASSKLAVILSSTGGTAATLNLTDATTMYEQYLDITDINVTPANTWYYAANSVWHSGTGWVSGAAPTPSGIKTINGLAIASVKKVKTIGTGLVKTMT